jgi:hypothetical protein
VVRQWQWPLDSSTWGTFVGSEQRHALQTAGRLSYFKSADDAIRAADNEVGHWLKTEKFRLRRRRRP